MVLKTFLNSKKMPCIPTFFRENKIIADVLLVNIICSSTQNNCHFLSQGKQKNVNLISGVVTKFKIRVGRTIDTFG